MDVTNSYARKLLWWAARIGPAAGRGYPLVPRIGDDLTLGSETLYLSHGLDGGARHYREGDPCARAA